MGAVAREGFANGGEICANKNDIMMHPPDKTVRRDLTPLKKARRTTSIIEPVHSYSMSSNPIPEGANGSIRECLHSLFPFLMTNCDHGKHASLRGIAMRMMERVPICALKLHVENSYSPSVSREREYYDPPLSPIKQLFTHLQAEEVSP